jgi:hypothetical protein
VGLAKNSVVGQKKSITFLEIFVSAGLGDFSCRLYKT